MGPCTRCGDRHAPGVDVCPITSASIEGGPCGTTIDRYQIERLLGGGGHGAVYRALHVVTQRPVALKILRPGTAESDGFDRLVREARATSAIGSPRIVQVFDAGVSERGEAFMAMELLEGCDLRALVEREGPRLAVARAVDLVGQLLEGLADAHARGIVHRDVKPANVFVTRDARGAEQVKILDFGISKVNVPGMQPTLPGQAMGTPGYMAPEQFTSARDADPRSDVWAAGVILYEMIAGVRPFDAQGYEALYVQVQGRARPLAEAAPNVPSSLGAVVDRALARDPDARWPSARAFADALRAQSSTSPSLASAPIVSTVPTRRDAPPPMTPGAEPQPIRLVRISPPTPAPYPTTPALAPMAATPQPIAQPHANEGARGLLWAVLGALVVLVIAAAGAVVWVATSRGSTNASTAATPDPSPTAAEQKSKKHEGDDDDDAPKKKKKSTAPSDDDDDSTSPGPKPEGATGAAMHEPGIAIDEPEIVGQLDPKEVSKVLKRAMPTMQACRRSVADDVKAQIHVHPGPTITLAQPHPDNKGDPGVARCVAHKFQDAAPGWHPGDNGIIGFEVHLDAKK